MPADKWTPLHWRHGCWVNAHTRSNGTRVKRHWRSGANVRGHYSANSPSLNAPPDPHRPKATKHRRTVWPRPSKPNKAITVVVPPSLNNAALALALSRDPRYQVQPNSQPGIPCGAATLLAVIYTDANGQRHTQSGLTTAMGAVTLPDQARQITLSFCIDLPDQETRNLRVDTPVFFNADETVTTIAGQHVDPEHVNRLLDRLANATKDPVTRARRRNSVRETLGAANPEQAVRHAISDIMTIAPPPDLNVTHPVTIPCPGTGYAITIHPLDSEPVYQPPRKRLGNTNPTRAR